MSRVDGRCWPPPLWTRRLPPVSWIRCCRYLPPSRVEWIDDNLRDGDFEDIALQVPTSVLYSLAADPALRDAVPDMSSIEISALEAQPQSGTCAGGDRARFRHAQAHAHPFLPAGLAVSCALSRR